MGGGTATSAADFTTYEGTYTLGANETAVTLSLPVLDDAAVEGNETAKFELFGLTGISLSGSSTATVTLIDDDFAASGDDTTTQRPLSYTEYDNLSRAVVREQYDGDAVTITSSSGVPNRPSSTLLRAKQASSFDDQNRVYRTDTYSVTYTTSTATVSTYTLQSLAWYNARGMVMKSLQPGGQVSKTEYDGAGRAVKMSVTDGGGDTGYSHAGDVTGDIVYTQSENDYATGTLLRRTIRRDRFHDATATGALQDKDNNPKARVSYAGMVYDVGNRLTASVNVGTNGGSAWSYPGSVPSRSATVLVTGMGYNTAGWVETTTDPRNIAAKTEYDDLGRTVKKVEAYVNGVISDQDDKTTTFGYDGSGHMTSYKAWLVDGPDAGSDPDYQDTGYLYGVRVDGGSYLNSNDILLTEKYPDKSTGNPSSATADQVSYKVNAFGQRVAMTDRNGSVHGYAFDTVGRMLADSVTTLGSGVDGAVRRLATSYDSAGRAFQFTSYDAASGGSVVNQVQRGYNGLGQLGIEYQEPGGAVNTSTSLYVSHSYTTLGVSTNDSRLGNYATPSRTVGLSYDTIGRITSINDDTATLEEYQYLGLGTAVERAHAQSGVDLTYIGSSAGEAGDQYVGLDRFGRIVDQRWTDGTTDKDRFQYGYDEHGNRLYRDNLLDSNFDELYHADGSSAGYDKLNQLTDFQRGALSDSNTTVTTASRTQVWAPDALGNFNTVVSDASTDTRTHNRQNQLTQTVVGSTTTTLTFDNAGNTTDDGPNTYAYDAWNRLVTVNSTGRYAYDPLNRRLTEGTRSFLYSSQWQVLEERASGTLLYRYAWSPVYVDAMIARDTMASGSMTERFYVLADANFNITALVNTSGSVVERHVYDPYGTSTKLAANFGSYSGTDRGWVYLHQGGRWDATSGMYHFRRRDLNAGLGRWEKVDPIGYKGLDSNVYRFEGNRPSSSLDPSGLICIIAIGCWKARSIGNTPSPGFHCGIRVIDGLGVTSIDGYPTSSNPPRLEIGAGSIWSPDLPSFFLAIHSVIADEDVCECLRKYPDDFNRAGHLYSSVMGPSGIGTRGGANSNWALKCMMQRCSVELAVDPKPFGYDSAPCISWETRTFPPAAGARCGPGYRTEEKVCTKYAECPQYTG